MSAEGTRTTRQGARITEPGFPAWAQMTDARREHVRRVVQLLERWADEEVVPEDERRRWMSAAFLHDAVKDAPIEWLREQVEEPWNLDALLHGPAAANIAERHGEHDEGVLSAVRYHSVGFAGWDRVGVMLYLADFLEPGRPLVEPWLAELRDRVPEVPYGALRRVATLRIRFLIDAGMPLISETVDFWNGL